MKPVLLRDFTDLSDLRVYQCGEQECEPGHAWGPAVRDHYLIHFALSGQGVFQSQSQAWHLSAGQGFLICPEQTTSYHADLSDPWHYVWIGFKGVKAAEYLRLAGLSEKTPILDDHGLPEKVDCRAYFTLMAEARSMKRGRELYLLGTLHLLLAKLAEANPAPLADEDQLARQEWYVQQAADFLAMNYSRKISISDIARQLGLDRSYFGSLFHQHTGLAPQQYLLRLRMEKAAGLLTRSNLPVSSVSRSVGYEDPLLFSRMFRKVQGQAPSEYRAANQAKPGESRISK